MGATWVKAAVLAAGVVWGATVPAKAANISFDLVGMLGDNSRVYERVNFNPTTGLASIGIERTYFDRFLPDGTNPTIADRYYKVPSVLTVTPFVDAYGVTMLQVDLTGLGYIEFYSDQFPVKPYTVDFQSFYVGGGVAGGNSGGGLTVGTAFLPVPLPAAAPMFGAALLAFGAFAHARRLMKTA